MFHNGHLGEPLALTNNAGSVVWLTDYKPYGQLYGESGSVTIGNPGTTGIVWKPAFRFPGQLQDNETALFYNLHRYYQPGLGNFTQPDPLVDLPPYVYSFSNPVMFVDPTGLASFGVGTHTSADGAVWTEIPPIYHGFFAVALSIVSDAVRNQECKNYFCKNCPNGCETTAEDAFNTAVLWNAGSGFPGFQAQTDKNTCSDVGIGMGGFDEYHYKAAMEMHDFHNTKSYPPFGGPKRLAEIIVHELFRICECKAYGQDDSKYDSGFGKARDAEKACIK